MPPQSTLLAPRQHSKAGDDQAVISAKALIIRTSYLATVVPVLLIQDEELRSFFFPNIDLREP